MGSTGFSVWNVLGFAGGFLLGYVLLGVGKFVVARLRKGRKENTSQ